MSNLLLYTEQFYRGQWNADPGTGGAAVTANTAAAPSGFGVLPSMADTVADDSATVKESVFQDVTIPGSTLNYFFSVFVQKDATTSRFVQIRMQFRDVANFDVGINLNTQTGVVDDPGGILPGTAFGALDYDANYWRAYIAQTNDGNTRVQCAIYPAATDVITNGGNVATQGSAIFWGANLTQSGGVFPQAYDPDPFYSFFTGVSWLGRTDIGLSVPTRYVPTS